MSERFDPKALRDSIDADVLRDDYPQELVEEELRKAGCDPAELAARNRPKIDAMLAKRRQHRGGDDVVEHGHPSSLCKCGDVLPDEHAVGCEWAARMCKTCEGDGTCPDCRGDGCSTGNELPLASADDAAVRTAAAALYREAREIEERGTATGIFDRFGAADVIRALAPVASLLGGGPCHDRGCGREAGHQPPHASRTWNAQLGDEVVDEWTDDGHGPADAEDRLAALLARFADEDVQNAIRVAFGMGREARP